ncbi:MAG TPA: UvrD-helicase domain-containing protein [Candidatus Limnocylindrales bacterium]|nr:UvrD-helicase domain-containing protein [Candidatus Limnocylindrales bacterium]
MTEVQRRLDAAAQLLVDRPGAGSPSQPAAIALTDEQRRIVEWGDGPEVVIAGAGTGKTRVIVERVKHLLETRGEDATTDDPLLPEHLLVLTYNVKAAAELRERIAQAMGVATAARMTISNFHSFCQGVLTDHAADAGLPPRPEVLDGVGQLLLLRKIAPGLGLLYHTTNDYTYANVVSFISRCKDELVKPADFVAFVVEERRAFEARFGSAETAVERLETQGNLRPLSPGWTHAFGLCARQEG